MRRESLGSADRGDSEVAALLTMLVVMTVVTSILGQAALVGIQTTADAETGPRVVTSTVDVTPDEVLVTPGLSDPLKTEQLTIKVTFPETGIPGRSISNVQQAAAATQAAHAEREATTRDFQGFKKVHIDNVTKSREVSLFKWEKPHTETFPVYEWEKIVGGTVLTVEAPGHPGPGWEKTERVRTITKSTTWTATSQTAPGPGWSKAQEAPVGTATLNKTIPQYKWVPDFTNTSTTNKVAAFTGASSHDDARGKRTAQSRGLSQACEATDGADTKHRLIEVLSRTLPFLGPVETKAIPCKLVQEWANNTIVRSVEIGGQSDTDATGTSAGSQSPPKAWQSGAPLVLGLTESVSDELVPGDLVRIQIIDTASNTVVLDKTRRVKEADSQSLETGIRGQSTEEPPPTSKRTPKPDDPTPPSVELSGPTTVTAGTTRTYTADTSNPGGTDPSMTWFVDGYQVASDTAAFDYDIPTIERVRTVSVLVTATDDDGLSDVAELDVTIQPTESPSDPGTDDPPPSQGQDGNEDTGVGDGDEDPTDDGNQSQTADPKPPTVQIEGPTTVVTGDRVRYEAEATPGSGQITSYTWSVHAPGRVKPADGSGEAHSLAFEDHGTATVQVTVNDDEGQTASDTKEVEVTAPPTVRILGPSTRETGQLGTYRAIARSPHGGEIRSYAWWVDGQWQFAWDDRLRHTFGKASTVPVTVRVTDDEGQTATATKQVTVEDIEITDAEADDINDLRVRWRQSDEEQNGYTFIVTYTNPATPKTSVTLTFSDGYAETVHLSKPNAASDTYRATVYRTFTKRSNNWIAGHEEKSVTVTARVSSPYDQSSVSRQGSFTAFIPSGSLDKTGTDVTASPKSGEVGQRVTLSVTGRGTGPFVLQFGDGEKTTITHRKGGTWTKTVSHTYEEAGVYTARLQISRKAVQQYFTGKRSTSTWAKTRIFIASRTFTEYHYHEQIGTKTRVATTKPGPGWTNQGLDRKEFGEVTELDRIQVAPDVSVGFIRTYNQLTGRNYQYEKTITVETPKTETRTSATRPDGQGWSITERAVDTNRVFDGYEYTWSRSPYLDQLLMGENGLQRVNLRTRLVRDGWEYTESATSPGSEWTIADRNVDTKRMFGGYGYTWSSSSNLNSLGHYTKVNSKRVLTERHKHTYNHEHSYDHKHTYNHEHSYNHKHTYDHRHSGSYDHRHTYSYTHEHCSWWGCWNHRHSGSYNHRHTYSYNHEHSYTHEHSYNHEHSYIHEHTYDHEHSYIHEHYETRYKYRYPTYRTVPIHEWKKPKYTTVTEYKYRYPTYRTVPVHEWERTVMVEEQKAVYKWEQREEIAYWRWTKPITQERTSLTQPDTDSMVGSNTKHTHECSAKDTPHSRQACSG